MSSFVPCKKNDAAGYIFYVSLIDQSNTKLFKANPTLATGDVKLSIDGAAFNNLGTLPTVAPAAGVAVKVTLSQAETNGDNLYVVFSDAAGAEWCDLAINLQTAANHLDDLATASSLATVQTGVTAIQTSTSTLGTGTVVVIAPITTASIITLFAGDDYSVTDGRQIDWVDPGSDWPALTGTIAVKFFRPNFNQTPTLNAAGSIITIGPPLGKVRLQLTAAQTALLVDSSYNYQVIATLASGRVVTLVSSICNMGTGSSQ